MTSNAHIVYTRVHADACKMVEDNRRRYNGQRSIRSCMSSVVEQHH